MREHAALRCCYRLREDVRARRIWQLRHAVWPALSGHADREEGRSVCVFHSSFSFYRPADRRPLLKHKSLLTNGCLSLVTKWCVDEETEQEAGLALAVCRQFNPEQSADSLMNERKLSAYKDTHLPRPPPPKKPLNTQDSSC